MLADSHPAGVRSPAWPTGWRVHALADELSLMVGRHEEERELLDGRVLLGEQPVSAASRVREGRVEDPAVEDYVEVVERALEADELQAGIDCPVGLQRQVRHPAAEDTRAIMQLCAGASLSDVSVLCRLIPGE